MGSPNFNLCIFSKNTHWSFKSLRSIFHLISVIISFPLLILSLSGSYFSCGACYSLALSNIHYNWASCDIVPSQLFVIEVTSVFDNVMTDITVLICGSVGYLLILIRSDLIAWLQLMFMVVIFVSSKHYFVSFVGEDIPSSSFHCFSSPTLAKVIFLL